MKKKKKNKKKTGKMRETKRARVKNASPSAERRERLSLTLSLRVKLDHAQEISVSLLAHESPTTGFVLLFWRRRFSSSSSPRPKEGDENDGEAKKGERTTNAALLCSLKTFESK
jgi:hypothetical protein